MSSLFQDIPDSIEDVEQIIQTLVDDPTATVGLNSPLASGGWALAIHRLQISRHFERDRAARHLKLATSIAETDKQYADKALRDATNFGAMYTAIGSLIAIITGLSLGWAGADIARHLQNPPSPEASHATAP